MNDESNAASANTVPKRQQAARGSLREQLIFWFFILSFGPLLVVSWLGYEQASRSLVEAAERDLENTAIEKQRFLDMWFNYRRTDLLQLADDPQNARLLTDLHNGYQRSSLPLAEYVRSFDWALRVNERQNRLIDFYRNYDYVYDLFLIDAQGNVLFSVARESDLGTNLVDGTYAYTLFARTVRESLETGLALFSDLERYAPSNNLVSGFLAAPILNDQGERVGVFAMQLRIDRINQLLLNEEGSVAMHYLVGRDSILRTAIGSDPEEVLNRVISGPRVDFWLRSLQQGSLSHGEQEGVHAAEYTGPMGNAVIGLHHRTRLWNVDWLLVSEVDRDQALASAVWLGKVLAFLCAITVLVVLVLAVLISRRISQPLIELARVSDSVADGQTDQQVQIVANNEIGRLADAFNHMLYIRHRNLKDLRKSHHEAREALAELADQRFALDQHAIVAITNLKGEITYANRRFAEISGYGVDELLGQNHRILNSGIHAKAFFKEMYGVIGRGRVWHGELCNRRKDGSLYWVDTTIVPFKGDDGKPKSYIAIRTDITERKLFELELLKSKDAAESAAKAKSEFLASMSHEIRTPMNGVLGMLGLLERSDLGVSQQRYASLARSSAESLLTLINDILDFSKVEAGRLDIEELDFNLPRLLGDFVESMALRAHEKDVELVLDVSGITQMMVKGDPGRLRQILTNLVGNAIKFTQDGDIVVAARLEPEGEGWKLSCEVRDTGIGIDESKLESIFDVFTQVDASTTRRFGGTGLGLAIVKRLCDLMGGDVSASSELGKGSCFNFYIYLTASEQSQPVRPVVNLRGIPMLIVDDNSTNREVLRGQLELWGADVSEAADGQQALEMLVQRASNSDTEPFAVALLDFHMPGMDGAELGRLIRSNSRWNDMKLVMMTSMAERGDARHFADLGFNAYFPKPATTSDLFDALSIVLAGGEALQQAQPLVTSHYVRSLEGRAVDNLEEAEAEEGIVWPEHTRILLVEDNYVNQVVAQSLLESMGLSSDVAGDGIEALTALRQSLQCDQPYTLVLMDCQMPEMDGYEATRRIRQGAAGEQYRDLTIIAMTANAMKGDREKCLAAGMNDYLSKPIDGDHLLKALHRHLLGQDTPTVQDMQEVIELDTTVAHPQPSVEAAQEPQAKPVWNQEDVLRRIGGRKKLLGRMIEVFRVELPPMLEGLRQAWENQDAAQIIHAAHSIKGMAGNIGGDHLSALAAEIEHQYREPCNMADQGSVADTPVSVVDLARLESAATELLERLQAES